MIATPTAVSASAAAPSILFVTTCWWPSLARLMQLACKAGLNVAAVCPPGHPAEAISGLRVFPCPAFRVRKALTRAIAATGATVLVPGDDRAVAHLHALHRTGTASERRLVETSLGDPAHFGTVLTRAALLDCARRAGMDVPATARIDNEDDLRSWSLAHAAPWVIKADGAWSGAGVRIVTDPAGLTAAYRGLSRGVSLPTALKRALINRDAYWLADRRTHGRRDISAQAHVQGRPGNLAMFCQNGRILAATIAESVACWGQTGPSTIVRLVHRPRFLAGARALAAALGLSGFQGLDFMVDDATGEALLIELNPRATALCNIRGQGSEDLVAAAIQAWSGRIVEPAAPLGTELVAHFPLAWHWNRQDERLAQCHHDIPLEEPALVAAMLRRSWPDRHWQARALNWCLRAAGRPDDMETIRLDGALPDSTEALERSLLDRDGPLGELISADGGSFATRGQGRALDFAGACRRDLHSSEL